MLAQKASRYVCAQREAASSKDVCGEKQQKNREWVCVCVKGAFLTEKGYMYKTYNGRNLLYMKYIMNCRYTVHTRV